MDDIIDNNQGIETEDILYIVKHLILHNINYNTNI